MTRRAFARMLGLGAASTALARGAASPAAVPNPVRARRPKPPYRVWFQPDYFHRDVDLYANMTIDASGWLDPRLAELAGKTTLDWVYGLNHPYAKGPEYWREACGVSARTYPRKSLEPRFVSAGIAVDEWVPPKLPDNERWLVEGLSRGKKENPDVFIAIWTTDPTPALLELGRNEVADLIIVEGYTHSVVPGLSTSWENALRRCEALVQAGLEARTLFSFGHITAEPNHRGERLKPAWLREKAQELKRRYPRMPGLAFFQSPTADTPDQRELVRFCDRLSQELWP